MNEDIKQSTACEETSEADNISESASQTVEETEEKLDRKEKKLVKKLEAEMAELMAKNASLESSLKEEQDRALRVMAEYDNFRRRSKAERESVYTDAYTDAIGEMLPIIDNLERVESLDCPENVKQGLVMILNAARETLKKMGVEEIAAEGCEFDPNIHNAVMHTDDDTLGENVVSAVLQKGYRRGDKIIRYAMVQVAN